MTRNSGAKKARREAAAESGSSYRSTGRSTKCSRCGNQTLNPSGLCYLHESVQPSPTNMPPPALIPASPSGYSNATVLGKVGGSDVLLLADGEMFSVTVDVMDDPKQYVQHHGVRARWPVQARGNQSIEVTYEGTQQQVADMMGEHWGPRERREVLNLTREPQEKWPVGEVVGAEILFSPDDETFEVSIDIVGYDPKADGYTWHGATITDSVNQGDGTCIVTFEGSQEQIAAVMESQWGVEVGNTVRGIVVRADQ